MSALIPHDPFFQELFDFRRDFDQIFNRFLNGPTTHGRHILPAGFTPSVESFIEKDTKKFHCQIMLPGVDPKDVSIQVLGNTLMISGERTSSRETNEADYLHREITYGSFERTLVLPEGVEKDKLNAEYRNGVLEITAPISAAALPRKIEVKSLPAAKHAAA
jgi:HSP20 family protein